MLNYDPNKFDILAEVILAVIVFVSFIHVLEII